MTEQLIQLAIDFGPFWWLLAAGALFLIGSFLPHPLVIGGALGLVVAGWWAVSNRVSFGETPFQTLILPAMLALAVAAIAVIVMQRWHRAS